MVLLNSQSSINELIRKLSWRGFIFGSQRIRRKIDFHLLFKRRCNFTSQWENEDEKRNLRRGKNETLINCGIKQTSLTSRAVKIDGNGRNVKKEGKRENEIKIKEGIHDLGGERWT